VTAQIAAIIAASVVTFVATSMDNLLLLVGFRTSDSIRPGIIGLAYVATVAAVSGLALALAAVADDVIPFRLGYLGFAPIAIGVYHGVNAFRAPRASPDGTEAGVGARSADATGFASVFFTMLANSGDSFLVFMALLGDTRSWLDGVVVGALVTMSVLWVRIAAAVTEHPRLRDPLRGFARFGLPILLVCVGLYILLDTPTDVVGSP